MAAGSSQSSATSKPRLVRVVITKDGMSAMMAISDPHQYGGNVTEDEIKAEIERAGVVYGVDWDAVRKALESGVYDTPVKIASGIPAKRGADSTFEYAFETEKQLTPEEAEDGRIDYRSINFIQNVREGTVLVRKTPPTTGEDGRTVDGRILPGLRGRDFPFPQGANTRISDDGTELVAAASGAIVFTRSGVSVNDVTSIQGDVDMSVGNIDCIGSVRVGGEIQAGFSLRVGGNLDVAGNIADCNINCEGNILVRGGCYGKGEGNITADGDIAVKYAEGMRITAGNDLLVGEELLKCQVCAGERVHVKSRKGKIIGGEVAAGKEIRVANAGNEAGTATVLRVGYNPELMRDHRHTVREIERIDRDCTRVKQTLVGMYKLQMNGNLDESKVQVLKQLENFQKTAPAELERLRKHLAELEEQLKEVADACIIVEGILHHGVTAYFGSIYREFADTHRCCRLTLEHGRVVLAEYAPDKS